MTGLMSQLLNAVLYLSLIIHLVLIAVCVWKVWRGHNSIDRLIAADLIGTLMLAVLVLISLIEQTSIYIDAAVGFAALGFIGTIAMARFIADRRVS